MYGGTVTAGPLPGGGFGVTARLPCPQAAPREADGESAVDESAVAEEEETVVAETVVAEIVAASALSGDAR